ncbi:MAG TPA: hypothetical protein VG604_05015 [Candidatus Saccharimonadales bacterium]|nr:hypothetical protein [Candidatus Saccharimonadales bacterium]
MTAEGTSGFEQLTDDHVVSGADAMVASGVVADCLEASEVAMPAPRDSFESLAAASGNQVGIAQLANLRRAQAIRSGGLHG